MSKHNKMTVQTKIVEVLEKNKWYAGCQKYKCAFTCESKSGKPRLCVSWQRFPSLEVGCEAILTGKLINNVFMVWDMKLWKLKENEYIEEI